MINPKQRKYKDLRGTDFANNDVKLYRSPNCINMWKNYKTGRIETRDGMTLKGAFGLQIYGLYFYDIMSSGSTVTKVIVHAGTKLYTWDNYPTTPVMSGESSTVTEIFTGMNVRESQSFVFNNIFFIKDGINYLEYNGTTVSEVVGTIPITANNRKPEGISYDTNGNVTAELYQDVNLLNPKRKNAFVADGTSTIYYLDTQGLDSASTYLMTATINGITKVEDVDFTVNRTTGIVTFGTAPTAPLTAGTSNVVITLSKTISGYADRIKKSTILTEFDKRIFFAGNQDYPNTLFHCELEDPRYVRDNAYYIEGLDLSPIKAIVPGNDVLWVLKEPNQTNTTIFYHAPTIDSIYGKIYPSQGANIATGCISTGINFSDDIVFFSNRGLEAITGNINSEKLLSHRSSLVDPKMIVDTNYSRAKIVEYNGYLLTLVNGHIYLADSRQRYTNELTGDMEYEWYYWELPNTITFIKEIKGNLFFGNATGQLFMYSGTTDNLTDIVSKWTTPKDNFGTDTLFKMTNKRGATADVSIKSATITVKYKKDNGSFITIGSYADTKGYIVFPIKAKKFKDIQLEFSSTTQWGIDSITLEAFDGSYVKR